MEYAILYQVEGTWVLETISQKENLHQGHLLQALLKVNLKGWEVITSLPLIQGIGESGFLLKRKAEEIKPTRRVVKG